MKRSSHRTSRELKKESGKLIAQKHAKTAMNSPKEEKAEEDFPILRGKIKLS